MKKTLFYIFLFIILLGVFYFLAFRYVMLTHSERNSKFLKSDASWVTRLEHARLLSYSHHYEESISELRKLLELKPDSIEAKLQLAEVLSWQKNYPESMTLYQQLLAQDPQNIQIRRKYALLLVWMGRQKEGAEELKKTLSEEKKNNE